MTDEFRLSKNDLLPLLLALNELQTVSRLFTGFYLCRDRSAFDRNPLKLWALMANKSTLSPYKNR
jgi:hypothetical protein